MRKDGFIEALRDYEQACSKDELRFVDSMRDFVLSTDKPFCRSTEQGHITASAWILNTDRTHALLCHHRKLDMWIQLGGHMEPEQDDSVFAGATREAYEESGLGELEALAPEIFDIDIHRIPAHGAEPAHLHYDVRYLFAAKANNAVQLTRESKDLAWVKLDEVHTLSQEQSLLRMAEKSLRYIDRSR